MNLLVTMGIPTAEPPGDGVAFRRARLEVVDWDRKRVTRAVEYVSPPDHLGPECSLKFTGGCAYRGRWFQATNTEIVVYDTNDWSIERVISLPSFNDVHGCAVADEEIVVANAGLEMIQFLDMEGAVTREVNVSASPTWERFDRTVDYRRVRSTKPHDAHVNHVFRMHGQWWATRCLRGDAVNLDDPADRIEIGAGQPHDGLVRGDFVYFTTTNARLVVASASTRRVEEVIDMNALARRAGGRIGWCRGLEVVEGTAYVGFSSFRPSKWGATFHWTKDLAFGRKRHSHIDRVDLVRRELLDGFDYAGELSQAGLFTLMDFDRVTGARSAS